MSDFPGTPRIPDEAADDRDGWMGRGIALSDDDVDELIAGRSPEGLHDLAPLADVTLALRVRAATEVAPPMGHALRMALADAPATTARHQRSRIRRRLSGLAAVGVGMVAFATLPRRRTRCRRRCSTSWPTPARWSGWTCPHRRRRGDEPAGIRGRTPRRGRRRARRWQGPRRGRARHRRGLRSRQGQARARRLRTPGRRRPGERCRPTRRSRAHRATTRPPPRRPRPSTDQRTARPVSARPPAMVGPRRVRRRQRVRTAPAKVDTTERGAAGLSDGPGRRRWIRIASRCSARRIQSARVSSSPRASGRSPQSTRSSGVARPARERRSILRRWPKPASTRRNTALRRRSSPGGGRRRSSTRPDSTRGWGTNTRGRHLADDGGVGPPRPPHRRDAVGLRSRAGGQSLTDLELHEHEHPLDRRRPLQQVEHQRGGDVVGQVGDEDPGRMGGQQRRPVEAKGIALDHGRAGWLDHVAQDRSEASVDLDGGHRRPGLEQRQGERTEPGAHLDHVITGSDAGQPRDPAHGVGVGHEVLPERPGGRQPVGGEQRADRGRRVGHRGEPGRASGGAGQRLRGARAGGRLRRSRGGQAEVADDEVRGSRGLGQQPGHWPQPARAWRIWPRLICSALLAWCGYPAPPTSLPGGQRELQAAVVAVAGVHRPVPAALALGEALPGGGSFGSPWRARGGGGGGGGAVVVGAGGGGRGDGLRPGPRWWARGGRWWGARCVAGATVVVGASVARRGDLPRASW